MSGDIIAKLQNRLSLSERFASCNSSVFKTMIFILSTHLNAQPAFSNLSTLKYYKQFGGTSLEYILIHFHPTVQTIYRQTKHVSVFTWRHQILKSRTRDLANVLSTLGIKGVNFISVHNLPAQYRPSFRNQRVLNFTVMALRDIRLPWCLSKNIILISWFLALWEVKR